MTRAESEAFYDGKFYERTPENVEFIDPSVPFYPVLLPWVARVEPAGCKFWDSRSSGVARDLLHGLLKELAGISHRVLFQEFENFRTARVLITPDQDHDAAEPFTEFVCNFHHDRRIEAFPVLKRLLASYALLWRTNIERLLQRFDKDEPSIRKLLGGSERLSLSSAEWAMSDRHHGGESVCRLGFADSREGVYYKPRSLAPEKVYVSLLELLASETSDARALPPSISQVDCGTYGWSREVIGEREGMGHFRKIGGLIAVLTAIRGADFHEENLIWSNQGPVPIDLEGVFQPRWDDQSDNDTILSDLVRTCLLPSVETDGLDGRDISGICGSGSRSDGKQIPPVAYYNRVNEALMSVRKCEARGNQHPSGFPFISSDDLAELCDGFGSVLQDIVNGSGLSGWLATQSQADSRVLYRHTSEYGRWLKQSVSPDVLVSESAFAKRLKELAAVDRSIPAEVAEAEVAAMLNHDIPRFLAKAVQNAVVADSGKAVAKFAEAGSQCAARSLDRWSIRAIESTKGSIGWRIRSSASRHMDHPDPKTSFFLQSAGILAERLIVAWDTVKSTGFEHWLSSRVGKVGFPNGLLATSIHSGYPGVSRFLRNYGSQAQHERALRAAEEIDHRIREIFERDFSSDWFACPGAIEGIGSLFAHGDPNILSILTSSLPSFDWELIREWDVMTGTAGLVASLSIHGHHHLARSGASHLVRQLADAAPVSGYGHGFTGAGVALALSGEKGVSELLDREDAIEDPGINAWCQGAAGLGYGRVLLDRFVSLSESQLGHRDAGLHRLATGAVHSSDHLCCGNAGRLWMALTVSERCPALASRERVTAAATQFFSRINSVGGLRLAEGSQLSLGGFFQGLSGIGSLALRFVDSTPDDFLAFDLNQ